MSLPSPAIDAADALDALLAESASAAVARERSALDDLGRARGTAGVVLFGAGGLGRRLLRAMRAAGAEPLAFADNDRTLHGTTVEGVQVLSPEDAAARYGTRATFVVAIWRCGGSHRFEQSRSQLESLGVRAIVPFPVLAWRYPEGALPHGLQDLPHLALEQADDIRRALALWSDDASRQEYVKQVRFRLVADFEGMSHPVQHPQYFPDDLFTYGPRELFVDCGAYDGDTIQVLLERHAAAVHRVIAIEPDPLNVARLNNYAASLLLPGGIAVLPYATARRRGTVHIAATGTESSSLTSAAGSRAVAVDAVPLDEVLAGETPTFIKMDIEGAEPDTLEGARATIARARPVLAVCLYHQQDHLWRIPLLLDTLCPRYRYFMRPHHEEGWELVCYAVPEERLLSARRAS